MKEQSPKLQPIYLKDYQPSPYLIQRIDLQVELGETSTRVHSVMKVRKNPQVSVANELKLDGDSLKLISVLIDEKPLEAQDYQITDKHLIIKNPPTSFELEIITEIKPQENTALSGLYRSNDLFCTQCEAEGFRRITYYLDRPDVMALFTTTIVADKARYPTLLSNGNLIDSGMVDEQRHFAKWEDPFKKPCYLFALVAGNLVKISDEFITRSKRKIKLEIFVEKGHEHLCDYAMNSLKKAMKWDEIHYGREYDLDIYMIVAVNDFNMGAMENKGLNIFNAKYILADEETATDTDFQNVEAVVGHEYFHNWTGNRITVRDWFQLSLKEGLTVFREQQFSEDMGLSAVKRINDVRIMRTRQFAEDAGPMCHPVRPNSYIEINNFYTSTVYNKGAEVLRMLHTLLGKEGFRKGMDRYFATHDGQAIIVEDFVACHEQANNISLTQFLNWYNQSGTPEVTVKPEYDTKKQQYKLTITQTCRNASGEAERQPFLIPIKITLYAQDGSPISIQDNQQIHRTKEGDYLILNQASQTFTFENVTQAPIPSFLGNFSAPIKLNYDYRDEDLALLMRFEKDGFNRWDAAQRFASKTIFAAMNGSSSAQTQQLIAAYRDVLNQSDIEPGLLAVVISLPSISYLVEQMADVDIQSMIRARQELVKAFSESLKPELLKAYQMAQKQDTGAFDSHMIGFRTLKNTTLYYLTKTHDQACIELAVKQYENAKNMTDKIGALSALSHLENGVRDKLFAHFYDKYKTNTLVVNKWLGLQAGSDRPQTLATIKQLMNHEAFDINNPNKVYALINTFGMANPEQFHDASGAGYEFIADIIIKLNTRNPQVAARALEALTPWRRYQKQGLMMKAALTRISELPKLSEDVYEIVSKSLA